MFAMFLFRNENKDIKGQRPSKVVEFVSKTKFELLVLLFLRWYDEILVFFCVLAVSLDPWKKLVFALFKKTIQHFALFPKIIREMPLL